MDCNFFCFFVFLKQTNDRNTTAMLIVAGGKMLAVESGGVTGWVQRYGVGDNGYGGEDCCAFEWWWLQWLSKGGGWIVMVQWLLVGCGYVVRFEGVVVSGVRWWMTVNVHSGVWW
ncbi:hypothetical protein Hanom_Chr07g00667121 [Helianthus anomalus]